MNLSVINLFFKILFSKNNLYKLVYEGKKKKKTSLVAANVGATLF